RELGMKARADLEQARDPAAYRHPPLAWLGNAREHLEQRAFAGAVAADDAQHLAALNLEADIPERPELLSGVAADEGATAQHIRRLAPDRPRSPRHDIAQRDIALALCGMADHVFLAEPFGADDDVVGHLRADRRSCARGDGTARCPARGRARRRRGSA